MAYRLPTPTSYVSSSWQSHKDRNPPSSEPGTDYGSGYGSPVFAVDNGSVVNVQSHPSSGTGRFVEYRLDDGRTSRTLHMAETWVSTGQRISKGQTIGVSGASGYGDDWYYGPHAHQTLWPNGAFQNPTIDFALYVGGDAPQPPDGDDMAERKHFLDDRDRTLTKGAWKNLYLDDANSTSFAKGKCIVQTTAVVVAQGLPVGEAIKFRLVRTKAGTNEERGGTGAREAPATNGSTYAVVSDSYQLNNDDDGLRWQYSVDIEGVVVTKTEVSVIIFR